MAGTGTKTRMRPDRYQARQSACTGGGAHRDLHFSRFINEADPLADDVITAFAALAPGRGRRMLNQAVSEGIDAVEGAPPALGTLFRQLDHIPFWVDWDTIERGAEPYRRTGALGALIMGCYALPLAYCSGAGVKPLIFSGRLVHRAARRLAETAEFNARVSAPGGLRRFSEGFATIVRVRMIHAQVRLLLRQSGHWDGKAWGAPINQIEMAGSNLFFSLLAIDGLRRLGMRFSQREAEDVMQLWRYSGYLIGIDPELLCSTPAEGWRLCEIISRARLAPDEDSRALVEALMERALPELILAAGHGESPRLAGLVSRFCYGLSYSLIGAEKARALGYRKDRWRHLAPMLLRLAVWPSDHARRLIPGATHFIARKSSDALQRAARQQLGGVRVTFETSDQSVAPRVPQPADRSFKHDP